MTASTRPRPPGPIAGIALAALFAGALIQALAFRPGILVWDAIRQYGQALSGDYDDWHPPAMNWLWRQLGVFGAGPAPMLALQMTLYWSGFALVCLRMARTGRPLRTVAIVAIALMPVSLVLIGTVLKDSLMAGALMLATGLIAGRRPGDRVLGTIAAVLLVAAATLRFNALPACLPLLLVLLPAQWTNGRGRLFVVGLLAAIPLALALPVANRLLSARASHVALSLVIYDLGGITRFSGIDVLPRSAVRDPVAVNRRCYSPVSWDSYAWWVAAPCPIGFTTLEPVLAAQGGSPVGLWVRAIATHPVAYAIHRFAHFNQDVRFVTTDRALPPLSLASDPNPWGYAVVPNRWNRAVDGAATASLHTPLGWPIVWLALAASVLLLGTGGDRVATALAWSSLLYGLSYLPLGVASEVRYHLWTMIAAALAAASGLSGSGGAPASRRIAAIGLPATAIMVGLAARLLL